MAIVERQDDDRPGRMSDDDLISILRKEEAASRQYQDGTLFPVRSEAQDYYDRMPYGDEQVGSSSVVTSEFADAVENMMPGLMEVFAGNDKIVKFAPVAAGHEKAMEEANSYVPHCFMTKNNGFRLLSTALKDALMGRLGGMAVDLEVTDQTRDHPVQGITQDDIDMIIAQATEHEVELEMVLTPDPPQPMAPGPQGPMAEPPMPPGGPQMAPQGNVVPMVPGQPVPGQMPARAMAAPQETFSGIVTATRSIQQVVVEAIAPEAILFTPDAENEDACSMIGYYRKVTASDLIKLGLTQEEIDELDGSPPPSLDEAGRFDDAGIVTMERDDLDDSERPLWLVLAYVKADFDGRGESSMERVLYAHAGGVAGRILERVPWDEPAAVALATPILMPHSLVGRSLFDQTKDLQQISSALTRGMLDGLYVSIRPRPAVSDQVVLDSLLDWVPGAPIRFAHGARPGDGHIMWEKPPQVLNEALMALEYFNTVREQRTGTSRMSNQGLDADSLNKTKGGMQMMFSAAAQRQKLIARTFAETFMVRVYRLIYRAEKRAATGPKTYWSGDSFKTCDPSKWPDDMDLVVDVGLGTGNTEQELGYLTMLAQLQEKLITLQQGTGGPYVLPDNVANLTQKFSEKLGYKTPGMFFQPPEKATQIAAQMAAQPQQPPPDVLKEQAKVKGAIEVEKVKTASAIEVQKAQLADALEQRKAEAQGKAMEKAAELPAKELEAQIEREKMDLEREKMEHEQLKMRHERARMFVEQDDMARDQEHQRFMRANDESAAERKEKHDRMMARAKKPQGAVDGVTDDPDSGDDLSKLLVESIKSQRDSMQQLAQAIAQLAEAQSMETEVMTSSGKTLRARKVPRGA